MTRVPRLADIPRIPGALRLYQVSSIITGVFLLLLCVEVVAKFVYQLEFEVGGPSGVLALVPRDTVTAFNLSTGILIMHGWMYVLYLFADFRLWSFMRWPFPAFLLIALGGIIPTLSFFLEAPVTRRVRAYLAQQSAKIVAEDARSGTDSAEVQVLADAAARAQVDAERSTNP